MGRRRLQQKGNLYEQNGWWKLRWREDEIKTDGKLGRGWSKPVWIGPSTGPGRLTEKQAQRISWENFLSRLDQNNRTPQSVMTVAEFVERKFRPEHIDLLKKSGKVHYETQLKRILLALGEMRIRDVKTDDVQRLIGAMLRQGLSVQTAKHVKHAISRIFEHAIEKEWYSGANPARRVKLPEMARKDLHALSFDQAKELLGILPDPGRTMALMAILTSMNVAEICGLQWKRVNLSVESVTVDAESIPAQTIAVRRHWYLGEYTTLKKKSRQRNIPIPELLLQSLLDLKQRSKYTTPEDPVFASRNGTPMDAHNILNRTLKPAGVALGMISGRDAHGKPKSWLGWHVFRRSTATFADELGMSTGERKGLLGHSTDEMSKHYVQASEMERRRAILNIIGAKLKEEKPQPENVLVMKKASGS